MERFTNAIQASISSGNWYGALTLALTIPDICGRLENPAIGSRDRYISWWDRYMLHHYQHAVGASRTPVTSLAGGDAYALRCSYLHEGGSDITEQRAKVALDDFHFVAPKHGMHIHNNMIGNVLQLQVDIFAEQMSDAVRQWTMDVRDDRHIRDRMASLLVIHSLDQGIPGFIKFGT
jgi:hypothetical protein